MKNRIIVDIVVISFLAAIAESIQTCKKSGITSSGLKCWASCDLGRCGVEYSNPSSYLRCSWESQNIFNYTLALSFDGDSCDISNATYDKIKGVYTQTFYAENCMPIGTKADRTVTVWLEVIYPTGIKCEEIKAFRICTWSKPDPSTILGVYWDNASRLYFNITDSHCPSHELEYKVKYNMTNGERKRQSVTEDSAQPHMRYRESSQFNYMIQSTTDGFVYSDPVYGSVTTGPIKALDKKSFHFICSTVNKNGFFNATISWKKIGIIGHFDVNVFESGGNIASSTKTHKKFLKQKYYAATLKSLKAGITHEIEITAHNKGGKSETFKHKISASMCTNTVNLECSLSGNGKKWIEISWKSDADASYEYKVNYESKHPESSNSVANLKSHQRKYNVTDLQECARYKITVCAVLSDVEQRCCHVKSFTKNRVPKMAPNLVVSSISARTIELKNSGGNWKESEACGEIIKYIIKCRNMETTRQEIKELMISSKETNDVRLHHLRPYTLYNISVTAVNEAGAGPEKYLIVKTKEAKPDIPPEILKATMISPDKLSVTWEAVKNPNGNVTVYYLAVNNSKKVENLDRNCNLSEGNILCKLGGKTKSVKLNISSVERVKVRECTGNGTLCSDWSAAYQVESHDTSSLPVLVIVAVACGIMLIVLFITGMLYCLSSQGPKPTKPTMHPDVMNDIQSALLEDKNIKENYKGKRFVSGLDVSSTKCSGTYHDFRKKNNSAAI